MKRTVSLLITCSRIIFSGQRGLYGYVQFNITHFITPWGQVNYTFFLSGNIHHKLIGGQPWEILLFTEHQLSNTTATVSAQELWNCDCTSNLYSVAEITFRSYLAMRSFTRKQLVLLELQLWKLTQTKPSRLKFSLLDAQVKGNITCPSAKWLAPGALTSSIVQALHLTTYTVYSFPSTFSYVSPYSYVISCTEMLMHAPSINTIHCTLR